LFVQLAIVWLTVEALDCLNPGRWRRPAKSPASKRISFWCLQGPLLVSSVLLICEVWPPRQGAYECPPETPAPAWILWLRENSEKSAALVCLPFPAGYGVQDYQETTQWMYWGMLHRRRLVNGYSGFFPEDFVELKNQLAAYYDWPQQPKLGLYPWDSPGLKKLNAWGARFAVVKRSFATRDDVWQHTATKFRWAWVAGDEQHQLDIYEILPEDPE
jgi:hypothetical protein